MKLKLIKVNNHFVAIFADNEKIEIRRGDCWIYICPINGLDYGDDNNPIVKNNLDSNWFDKLHDKKNYYRVIFADKKLNLDVPQLPDWEQFEIEQLAYKFSEHVISKNTPTEWSNNELKDLVFNCYKSGYNDKTQYTEEDLKKIKDAIKYWESFEGEKQQGIKYGLELALEHIQSLKKLPKYLIVNDNKEIVEIIW